MKTLAPHAYRVDKPKPSHPWDRDSKKFKIAVAKVKKEMYKRERVMYVGELSLAAGISIERVEEVVDFLLEEGMIRYVSDDEKLALKLPVTAELVTYIEKAKLRHEEE